MIKMFRSDRQGEYFIESFKNFCEENCIIYQKTAPTHINKNGITERKNRSLVHMINDFLMIVKLPLTLLGEVLLTTCHIYNIISFKNFHASTYELGNNGLKLFMWVNCIL